MRSHQKKVVHLYHCTRQSLQQQTCLFCAMSEWCPHVPAPVHTLPFRVLHIECWHVNDRGCCARRTPSFFYRCHLRTHFDVVVCKMCRAYSYVYKKVTLAFNCGDITYIIKNENTLQLWDRILGRNSSLQAVCDTSIARITSCVSSLRI